MTSNRVAIVAARRTAIGSFQGQFNGMSAPQLGSKVLSQIMKDAGLGSGDVNEVIMGQVLTAGTGQAPARQAAIGAGVQDGAVCLTINKVCGSGLKAIMLGADSLLLGRSQVVLAGGQEAMSGAPHLLENSRAGYRMGNVNITDSMIKDGLWDPYNNFHMGNAAELCVQKYAFTREEQDAFAVSSYNKAIEAQKNQAFTKEIVAIEMVGKKGTTLINQDEEPGKVMFDKIPSLKPAFEKTGTITAANASKINDGAAAVAMMNESTAKSRGLKPLAYFVAGETFAQDPKWFTTAPVGAMKQLLQKQGLTVSDIAFWEINEAFANVTMAALKELEIPADRVNVNGGAIALGHPIGASGARVLVTLIHQLQKSGRKYGVASLCIGGGEAVAVLIENPEGQR